MRLWTAITGWAALMATAIALWAVGIAIEATPRASAGSLFRIAAAVAIFGTFLLLGDVFLLGRAAIQQRRAVRASPVKFGKLDYMPEFGKAVDRYVAAQTKITNTVDQANALYVVKGPLLSQASGAQAQQLAHDLAGANHELSQSMGKNLKRMNSDVAAMRQCLFGLVLHADMVSAEDVRAGRQMRVTVAQSIAMSADFRLTLRGTRRIVCAQRKANLSHSLNTSADQLVSQFDEYINNLSSVMRSFRRASRMLGARLIWASIRP